MAHGHPHADLVLLKRRQHLPWRTGLHGRTSCRRSASRRGDVELFCYDHSSDRIDSPLTVFADAEARKFIKGVAHLYAGETEAMSEVAKKRTTIQTYFTEYWADARTEFAEGLRWHVENILIGASRNGTQAILEGNLAVDPNHPHTEEGGNLCLGALTIGSSTIVRNLSYYVMAHLSRFVRPGSVRIESNPIDSLPNVAFRTPDGQAVLLVLNSGSDMQLVNIRCNRQTASHILDGGAVGTYVWRLAGESSTVPNSSRPSVVAPLRSE
jgi:glucosylceramidase